MPALDTEQLIEQVGVNGELREQIIPTTPKKWQASTSYHPPIFSHSNEVKEELPGSRPSEGDDGDEKYPVKMQRRGT